MREFDLVVLDREDYPFLVVEAKGRPIAPSLERDILNQLWSEREGVPYGLRIQHALIADPESIRLYRLDESAQVMLCSWPTVDTLGPYEPDLGETLGSRFGISGDYLAALINSWLDDLIYRWKSPTPPGGDRWDSAGLLPRFDGGSTRRAVPLGFDALR